MRVMVLSVEQPSPHESAVHQQHLLVTTSSIVWDVYKV